MDWVSTVAEITGCICQDRDSSKDSGSCTRSSANFLVGPWEGPSAYLWSVLGSFPPEPKLPLDQSQRKAECQARLWLEGVGAFIPFSQEPRGWGTTLPHSSGVQPPWLVIPLRASLAGFPGLEATNKDPGSANIPEQLCCQI